MEEKSAVQLLREARHEAWKIGDFKEIHVTHDFMQRLKACEDYPQISNYYDIQKIDEKLFGFPTIVHVEPSDQDFWFVDEHGRRIHVLMDVGITLEQGISNANRFAEEVKKRLTWPWPL